MNLVKLENPLYIGAIAPLIEDFYKKVFSPSAKKGISYESLYSYLVNAVQMQAGVTEVWVALDGNDPVAWASWNVLGFPFFGTVHCSCLYNKSRNKEVTRQLAEKFLDFAREKHAPYIIFDVHNEVTARHFERVLKGLNVEIEPTGITQFIGRVS